MTNGKKYGIVKSKNGQTRFFRRTAAGRDVAMEAQENGARRIERNANRLSGFGGKQMIDPYSATEPASQLPAGKTIGVFAAACKTGRNTEMTLRAAKRAYTA